MFQVNLCTVLILLLYFQLGKSVNQSLSRVLDRLDALEEDLTMERKHRREDVRALTHQLESLRQTCGCDTSSSVTPDHVLANTKSVEKTQLAYVEPSVIVNLRLAFKKEKQENARIRNDLTQNYDRLAGRMNRTMVDVTKNFMDLKQEMMEKNRDVFQNVTQVLDATNRTLSAYILDSTQSMGHFKAEMNNKIVNDVSTAKKDITKDIAETERRLMDTQRDAVKDVTVLIKNTELTLNQKLSALELAFETCQQQVKQKTSESSDILNETLSGVHTCSQSESVSGVNLLVSSSPILDKTPVVCDTTTDGGGWIVFQRRCDGSVDFYREWQEYKKGFGNQSEFWWGLEKLHAATQDRPRELRIDLEDFSGNKAYAHYTSFRISSESDNYAISVSGYSGTAGDALAYHNGKSFTTKDRDHDNYDGNCAERYTGAWWHDRCYHSNMNGKYQLTDPFKLLDTSPVWRGFNDWKAVKFVEMKLR